MPKADKPFAYKIPQVYPPEGSPAGVS